MRRSRVVVALVLGISAVSTLCVTTAVLADTLWTADKPMQFDLISRATAINNFVDTGPAGPSPGDLYVFSDRLFRTLDSTADIGTFEGRCTLLDPDTAHWDCSVSTTIRAGTSLPAGSIRGDGSLTFVEGSRNVGAITGGTDYYRNARGQGVVELGPFEGPHRLHYSLILSP